MGDAQCDLYDPCPQCRGLGIDPPPLLRVLNTRCRGDQRVQYLGCPQCGLRPQNNKRVIPIEYAPRQLSRIGRKKNSSLDHP